MGSDELLGQPDRRLGTNLRWTSIPSGGGGGGGGSAAILSHFMLLKLSGNQDKLGGGELCPLCQILRR